MSSIHIYNPEVKEAVGHIWQQNHSLKFFNKLRKFVKFYKGFCITKPKERATIEADLRAQLASAQIVLQSDLYNPCLHKKIRSTSEFLVPLGKYIATD